MRASALFCERALFNIFSSETVKKAFSKAASCDALINWTFTFCISTLYLYVYVLFFVLTQNVHSSELPD